MITLGILAGLIYFLIVMHIAGVLWKSIQRRWNNEYVVFMFITGSILIPLGIFLDFGGVAILQQQCH
jgi:D-alanyl-lipoteichoic acid acyltransferase DltB (MBOAT superfamily)